MSCHSCVFMAENWQKTTKTIRNEAGKRKESTLQTICFLFESVIELWNKTGIIKADNESNSSFDNTHNCYFNHTLMNFHLVIVQCPCK